MAKGAKFGGRIKGTPNRKTRIIMDKLKELKIDPIEEMVKLYQEAGQKPEIKTKLMSELAQYIYPKRKAIEHTGQIDQKHFVISSPSTSDEQLWTSEHGKDNQGNT